MVRVISLLLALLPCCVLAGPGEIVGRLLVFEDGARISPAHLRSGDGAVTVALEARRGAEVVDLPYDEDGFFRVPLAPGTWRIEYVRLGEGAEFFAPVEFEVTEGVRTCVGTLGLHLPKLSALGANTSSDLKVTTDCDEVRGYFHALAPWAGALRDHPAAPVPAATYAHGRSGYELVSGLRVGVGSGFGGSLLFTQLVAAWPKPFGGWWASFGLVQADLGANGAGGAVGAGLQLLGAAEGFVMLGARADARSAPGNVYVGGGGRLGVMGFGVGARLEIGSSFAAAYLTFDLAPLHILGSML